MIINDFLLSNFSKVTNLNFTTEIEKELDLIANGELKWYDMIKKFYKEFSIEIKKTKKNNDHFNKSRILGREPVTNKIVIARIGKYGPIIQIGEKDEKIKFSKLKKNQLIENITLEESLNLFKFPKSLGEFDKKEILVNIGRYGPYIIYDDKFYKIEKSSIGKEEAILTIKERIELNNKKIIKSFEDKNIKILDGK
ncbi:MAG: topoisomerase C-terminal repeat-containing protein [Cytophagales bacterium]